MWLFYDDDALLYGGLSVSILTKIGDSSSFGQLALNLTGDGLRHFALQYQDVAQIALLDTGRALAVMLSETARATSGTVATGKWGNDEHDKNGLHVV